MLGKEFDAMHFNNFSYDKFSLVQGAKNSL